MFVIVLVSLLACVQADFESIPFEFYEKLKDQANEQCSSDVKQILDGVKNLDRWALES